MFIFVLLFGVVLWQVGTAIYHLWFSPLSRIPGPKLAASTLLYEFYYEVICSGKYTRRIEKMHEKYGPIVRISPYEVHIKDPDFCVEAFSPVKKLDKWGWWYRVFGGPGATVSTEHHDVHRSRRATFKNFLSPVAVRGFVPTVLEKVKQAGLIMSRHAQMGEQLNLSNLYRCIAADTVSAYVLPASFNLLDSDDLGEEFQSGLRLFFEAATTMRFLGFLQPLMMMIPDLIFKRLLTDPAKSLIKLIRRLEACVDETIRKPSDMEKSSSYLLERIKTNNYRENGDFRERLLQEAEQFIVAGTETTGYALSVTTFYILQNADIQKKLRQELIDSQISLDDDLDIALLQNLPYLVSSSTLGNTVSNDVQYHQWRIPAGVPISMTSRLHHEDPQLFPDPLTFRPDRWLQPESKQLRKYLSPFGLGSRICPGMHLAFCEMYIAVAYIFTNFDVENSGTTKDDLISAHDLGAPFPKRDSKGLQVTLQLR
ncbi:cytochrome P450 [Trichoderma evansii]